MSERWTYKVLEVKAGMFGITKAGVIQDALNQQGLQGWELVSVTNVGFAARLYFKKPH